MNICWTLGEKKMVAVLLGGITYARFHYQSLQYSVYLIKKVKTNLPNSHILFMNGWLQYVHIPTFLLGQPIQYRLGGLHRRGYNRNLYASLWRVEVHSVHWDGEKDGPQAPCHHWQHAAPLLIKEEGMRVIQ